MNLIELIPHRPVLLPLFLPSLPGPLQFLDVRLGTPEFLRCNHS